MKKIFLKAICLFAVVTVFTSCEDEIPVYDVNGGQSFVGFNGTDARLPIFAPEDNKPNTVFVEVGSTVKTDYDRTFQIEIDEAATTALPSDYAIDETTFVIPAGEFVGRIKISGFYEGLPEVASRSLVLNLVEVQGGEIYNEDKIQFAVSIFRGCVRTVAAAYNVVITAPISVPSFEIVLAPVTTGNVLNTFSTRNLWGNFVTVANGSPVYPYPAELEILCDNTVIVTGTDPDIGGAGTGTFDEETKAFSLGFKQKYFTFSDNVIATLTPVQ